MVKFPSPDQSYDSIFAATKHRCHQFVTRGFQMIDREKGE
jgi:hypothetical protein